MINFCRATVLWRVSKSGAMQMTFGPAAASGTNGAERCQGYLSDVDDVSPTTRQMASSRRAQAVGDLCLWPKRAVRFPVTKCKRPPIFPLFQSLD